MRANGLIYTFLGLALLVALGFTGELTREGRPVPEVFGTVAGAAVGALAMAARPGDAKPPTS